MSTYLRLAIVLALPAVASAATIKVPQQFGTIGEAVDAAAAGDTIVVARGVYNERVSVEGKNGLRFIGKKAIWDGFVNGGKGDCLDFVGDNLFVQGFRFRNGGVDVDGNGATVTKCIIRSADGDAVEIDGNDATVSGCTMRGCYYGVDISGNNAVVTKNRVYNMDDEGIEVDGDDAEVTRNTVKVIEDGVGVEVDGDRCLVARNTITNTDEDCIEIDGDDAVVDKNRCTATGESGIDVDGDDFRITGNKIAIAVDDSDGMDIDTNTEQGGGLIEKNTIEDVVEDGLELDGNNVTLRNNKVIGQGSEDDEAFDISGNGNTLEGCQAIGCEGDGFDVSGDGNKLIKCKAVDCLEDGFDISGAGNEVIDCQAKNCDAEGMDNEGTNTVLRGGTFTGNRIDVANDNDGGATYATFAPKKFVTGGEDTQSEVD